jgi:hypothetical protein
MARRHEVSYFENCNCEAVRARVELRRRDERPARTLALAPVGLGGPTPPHAMVRG